MSVVNLGIVEARGATPHAHAGVNNDAETNVYLSMAAYSHSIVCGKCGSLGAVIEIQSTLPPFFGDLRTPTCDAGELFKNKPTTGSDLSGYKCDKQHRVYTAKAPGSTFPATL